MKTPKELPQDVTALQEMIRELVATLNDQEREIGSLKFRLEKLLRAKYGPQSEKIDENQLLLFAKEVLEKGREEEPEEVEEEPNPAKKRKGHGRKRRTDLPRERVEHDIPEEEKTCPCCGEARVRIGEETSEQLEYVPAVVKVIEHVRPKYACRKCESGVVTAEKPSQPIEKGMAGPGLLAQVIVSKYVDHLPLHRQQAMFRRYGLDLSKTTLCDWMAASAKELRVLYKAMKRWILKSGVIHTDDTPVQVQDRKRKKTRQGRVWVYIGDEEHPYTLYDYTPGRSREGPAQFLGKYKGFLQADAYAGYDHLYAKGDVKEAACWAHARRKFNDAKTSDPERAIIALAHIRRLYTVEAQADEEIENRGLKTVSEKAEVRLRLRREKAVPALNDLRQWLESQTVLPKSPVGEAVQYALNQWEALCRYTQHGVLSIDNNRAERALRPIAVGRKNWLFMGSDNGGHTAAVLYSLVQTCKDLGKNPFLYLRDVLARLPDHPRQHIDDLLPDRWQEHSSD